MNYNELSEFTFADTDKLDWIDDILHVKKLSKPHFDLHNIEMKCNLEFSDLAAPTKFCPKCHEKYPEDENFCLECAVALKDIRHVNVRDIEVKPSFEIEGNNNYNDFSEILTDENLEKIALNDFDIDDIVKDIKQTAIRRLDRTIKNNDILLDDLSIRDKVILFAKSFVDVEYKSYGPELGYYQFNRIYIDDRQPDALKITTLLHELTHFLNKEILTRVLCELLDCAKTTQIESIITFILSYSPLNQLVDEYAAHTVEGRFTLYGFQDYSSFLDIKKSIDRPKQEIEIIMTIGNTFANLIKGIVESFIDEDLLEDIKGQFRQDILDSPDYKNLALENCTLLNNEGLTRAIKSFILYEGFAVAMDNAETLEQYNLSFGEVL